MNKFCVYEHWRSDTNTCFYVGKGTIKRAHQVGPKTRNQHHARIVEKLKRTGFSYAVKLVDVSLFEKDAFALECERIKFWRDQGIKLTNMTNGGEGTCGHALSEEHKAKISARHLGKITSIETKEKMRVAQKGRSRPDLLGKAKSPEAKAKMSSAQKGIPRGPMSEEHKRKLGEASKGNNYALGNILSEETRAKMSASRKGKSRGPMSLEQKLKLSEALKGKKLSEESKARMSASLKDSWARRKAKLAEVSICG